MRNIIKNLIACAAFSCALFAPASAQDTQPAAASMQESPPVAATQSEKQIELAAFAEHYLPTELSVEGAGVNYERQSLRVSSQDEASIALEQQYPGVTKAAVAVGKLHVEQRMRAIIPIIQAKLIAYMEPRFSLPEIKKINAYYASQSSKNAMEKVFKNMDGDAFTDKAMEQMQNGDGTISFEKSDIMKAAQDSVLKSMSDAQFKEMTQFMTSPVGRKFVLNGEGILEIVTSSINQELSTGVAETQAQVMLAVRDYINSSNK